MFEPLDVAAILATLPSADLALVEHLERCTHMHVTSTEPDQVNAWKDRRDRARIALLRRFAALLGSGKDSERLAKLVALVGDKEDRGVVTLGWENGSCCVWAGDDGYFQESVGLGDDLAAALDDVELEDDDNVPDAARAGQSEETSDARD